MIHISSDLALRSRASIDARLEGIDVSCGRKSAAPGWSDAADCRPSTPSLAALKSTGSMVRPPGSAPSMSG